MYLIVALFQSSGALSHVSAVLVLPRLNDQQQC